MSEPTGAAGSGPAVSEPTGVITRLGPASATLPTAAHLPASATLPAAAGLPASATLPAAILDAIVAHARAEAPNEMCGLIVGTAPPADGGIALRWEAAPNAAASPRRFDMAHPDLIRLILEIDDRDEVVWAVAHSHPRSPAVPSAADVRGALLRPDALHLLVSLAPAEAGPEAGEPAEAGPAAGSPSVRAWRIVDGLPVEVSLEVR